MEASGVSAATAVRIGTGVVVVVTVIGGEGGGAAAVAPKCGGAKSEERRRRRRRPGPPRTLGFISKRVAASGRAADGGTAPPRPAEPCVDKAPRSAARGR